MSVLVTVFSSSYNRRNIITRLYESLKKQTSYNFKWLIVDDGSNDKTDELIKEWIKNEKSFQIEYYYKENGGMYTACNLGVEKADTELFINVDSDDWLPNDAIEKIEKIWNNIKDKHYRGFVGLDLYSNGKPVGEKFPENIKEIFYSQKIMNGIAPGDKKYIQKTEILKKVFPMIGYPGEKYFNPMYAICKADKYGPVYVTNECFCIVEYQEGGLSQNKSKQYIQSPNNYGELRRLHLEFKNAPFKYLFKESISYVAMYCLAGKFNKILQESPRIFYTILAIPFGLLYVLKIKSNVR